MRGYNKFTPGQTEMLGQIMKEIARHMERENIKKVGDAYTYVQYYHFIYLVGGQNLIGQIGSIYYEIDTSRSRFGQVRKNLSNKTPFGLSD
jgi:hypothetical protein